MTMINVQELEKAEALARRLARDDTAYENESFWEIAERIKAAREGREYSAETSEPFKWD
jgi:hypothetical protein